MTVIHGNQVKLLKNGLEFFPALIAAIDAAEHDVRIETYIFRDDKTGLAVGDALKRAARRGVSVRVIVDGFGSRETSKMFFDQLRLANVNLLVFRPEYRWLSLKKAHLRRTHRKIAIVDRRIAFVGGINLIDDFTESLSTYPRYDYALQIEGPVLENIFRATERLWNLVSWWSMRKRGAEAELRRLLRRPQRAGLPTPVRPLSRTQPEPARDIGNVPVQFLARDNFRHRREIEEAYLNAIANAKQHIVLVNSYFLPGRRLRRELMAAAKRGVHVTLLLQGRADHALMQLATRALYEQLLGVGVQIYEYEKSMLHGKVATVDDEWATVGSSNLDPFSLFLNREANVVVFEAAFARTLRLSVLEEIERGAKHCNPADWQRRPRIERAKTWLAYGFARLIAGWIGFKNEWHG
jgi:cardiolipin synthase A/B